eukprot:gene8500-10448_t
MTKPLFRLLSMVFFLQSSYTVAYTYQDESFATVIDRNLALHEYAAKAITNKGKKRTKYLIKFFNAFPRDFETYFKMEYPCYGDTIYTLYDEEKLRVIRSFFKNPWGKFFPTVRIIDQEVNIPKELPTKRVADFYMDAYKKGFFQRLGEGIPSGILREVEKVVPKEIYYRKMITVQIDAFDSVYKINSGEVGTKLEERTAYSFLLQAGPSPFLGELCLMPKSQAIDYGLLDSDAITVHESEQDPEMVYVELGNTNPDPLFMKILAEKTDEEILAFWYGYLGGAGPYVHHLSGIWREYYKNLVKLDARLAELMIKACDRVLYDDREGPK